MKCFNNLINYKLTTPTAKFPVTAIKLSASATTYTLRVLQSHNRFSVLKLYSVNHLASHILCLAMQKEAIPNNKTSNIKVMAVKHSNTARVSETQK